MTHEEKMLALIEQGERDAEAVLEALKATWAREDERTAANRQALLDAHERGARDRQAAREKFEAMVPKPAPSWGDVAAQEAEDAPKKASDLPVTPIAALGQG